MTVKDLVVQLSKCNQAAEVYLNGPEGELMRRSTSVVERNDGSKPVVKITGDIVGEQEFDAT